MKIQDQFATVEQCQKLKELGITARSLMWWVISEQLLMVAVTELSMDRDYGIPALTDTPIQNVNCVNAYSVAELGMMLPDGAKVKTRNGSLAQFNSFRNYGDAGSGYTCYADYSELIGTVNGYDAYRCWKQIEAPTEAQARAAMLIYLLENNHITAEEVNQRLLN